MASYSLTLEEAVELLAEYEGAVRHADALRALMADHPVAARHLEKIEFLAAEMAGLQPSQVLGALASAKEAFDASTQAEEFDARSVYDSLGSNRQALGLAGLLVRESSRLAIVDAGRAACFARWAELLLEFVGGEFEVYALGMRLRAQARRANALRILGGIREAARIFSRILEGLEGWPPLLRAEILKLNASVWTDHGEMQLALECLAEAEVLTDSLYVPEERACLGIMRAHVLWEAGLPREALQVVTKAMGTLESGSRHWVTAALNRGLYAADSGDDEEAEKWLARCPEPKDTNEQVHRLWIRGIVHGRAGRTSDASVALELAARRFLGLGLGVQASLVLLDLSDLLVEAGELERAALLAEMVWPIFRCNDLPAEAVAALSTYQRALQASAVTRASIDRCRAVLRFPVRKSGDVS